MQSEREIHIRGFPKTTKVNELRQFFNEYKSMQDVRIINDYAFIDFKQKADADRAIKEKNGKIFQGNALKIEKALHPQSMRTPKPTDQCNKCGNLGHWKRNCPNLMKQKGKKDRSQSNYKPQVKSRPRDRDRINNDKHKSRRRKNQRSSNSSSPDSSSKSSYDRSRSKYQKSKEKSKNKKKQKR